MVSASTKRRRSPLEAFAPTWQAQFLPVQPSGFSGATTTWPSPPSSSRRDLGRAVGRAVVDDQDRRVGVGLLRERREAVGQPLRLVAARDDDGQRRDVRVLDLPRRRVGGGSTSRIASTLNRV